MDKLQEIEDRYMSWEYDFNLDKECINWLIETVKHQKKRIQELESEIIVLKNINNTI